MVLLQVLVRLSGEILSEGEVRRPCRGGQLHEWCFGLTFQGIRVCSWCWEIYNFNFNKNKEKGEGGDGWKSYKGLLFFCSGLGLRRLVFAQLLWTCLRVCLLAAHDSLVHLLVFHFLIWLLVLGESSYLRVWGLDIFVLGRRGWINTDLHFIWLGSGFAGFPYAHTGFSPFSSFFLLEGESTSFGSPFLGVPLSSFETEYYCFYLIVCGWVSVMSSAASWSASWAFRSPSRGAITFLGGAWRWFRWAIELISAAC